MLNAADCPVLGTGTEDSHEHPGVLVVSAIRLSKGYQSPVLRAPLLPLLKIIIFLDRFELSEFC